MKWREEAWWRCRGPPPTHYRFTKMQEDSPGKGQDVTFWVKSICATSGGGSAGLAIIQSSGRSDSILFLRGKKTGRRRGRDKEGERGNSERKTGRRRRDREGEKGNSEKV